MSEIHMEMFPLCDEDGNFTGALKERSAVHRDGDMHGGSHIWIMEKQDGHIDARENLTSTALRELSEELSVKACEDELEFLFKQRVNGEYNFYGERFVNNEVNFVYLLKKHVDIEKLTFQKEEIQGLCWKDADEVLEALKMQDAREAAGEKNIYSPGSYCIWTKEFNMVLQAVKNI